MEPSAAGKPSLAELVVVASHRRWHVLAAEHDTFSAATSWVPEGQVRHDS
jgi:hypothetical protein